jgi:hypothetical protein
MCKETICKILGCNKQTINIPEPNNLEKINATEVLTALQSEFPEARLYLSDEDYMTTTVEELRNYLRYDIVDNYKYISEYFDCDDFSYALMGNLSNPKWGCLTFGILWTDTETGGHAVNCFIDKDRTVWIIEPQTDSIFRLPKEWIPYMIMM